MRTPRGLHVQVEMFKQCIVHTFLFVQTGALCFSKYYSQVKWGRKGITNMDIIWIAVIVENNKTSLEVQIYNNSKEN